MRKYFLLSAVAMLMTTTANATTDYAEVTAKATIEVATKYECSNLNFGTIVLKSARTEDAIFNLYAASEPVYTDDILSVEGYSVATCADQLSADTGYHSGPDNVVLKGANSNLTAELDYNDVYIGGFLKIPADVKSGDYIGTFTVNSTY